MIGSSLSSSRKPPDRRVGAPHWHGAVWILTLILPACSASRGPLVVTDPDPSIKIPAIQKAVREHDLSALPQLVKDLESDDPAVRMYANHALEQLTGQRFEFRYFDGDDERAAAVEKWKHWLNEYMAAREKPKGPQALVQAGVGSS